jgi:Putative beta-barrel porin-2, OmpL-like. bbp2
MYRPITWIRSIANRSLASGANRAARVAVPGIVVVCALGLYVVAVASPFVSFLLAAAVAIAWCVWLDKDDERRLKHLPRVLAAMLCLSVPSFALAQSSDEEPQAPAAPQNEQAVAASPSSSSSDPWRNIKFGATLEGYYEYNWNHPPDRSLALHAYDTRGNTFGIQQAALVFDAAPDVAANRRYGLRIDLQFGQATETVQGGAANEPRPNVYRHVWQAYGTYVFPVGRNGLQADFGKFASTLGYETHYAKDNQAFSRSYLFNFLPFYHSGLRLTLPVNDKVSLLYMLTNGIQQTEDFNDFKSNHFAAIVKPTPMVTWTVNYYFGQEQPDGGEPGGPDGFFRVFDSYVTVTPNSALTLGADVNYTTNEVNTDDPSLSLQGFGAYARYQATSAAAFGLRYERVDDEGLFGGIDQVLHETTATADYKFADGFVLRAEFRRDWSNERFFPGRGGTSDPRRGQNTALLGGIWVIGNKTGTW